MKKLHFHKGKGGDRLTTAIPTEGSGPQIDYERTREAFSMRDILEQAQVLHDHAYMYGPNLF